MTDPIPARGPELADYSSSDALRLPSLPPRERLAHELEALEAALAEGQTRPTRRVSLAVLRELSAFYGARVPGLRVLGSRPLYGRETTWELFGDYDLETHVIRLWMRTAVQARVTSLRTFLSTLLHELCHHLDVTIFALPTTPHTRGFYQRIDDLYHLVLGTDPRARRPLVWVATRRGWRIDWQRTRGGSKREAP